MVWFLRGTYPKRFFHRFLKFCTLVALHSLVSFLFIMVWLHRASLGWSIMILSWGVYMRCSWSKLVHLSWCLNFLVFCGDLSLKMLTFQRLLGIVTLKHATTCCVLMHAGTQKELKDSKGRAIKEVCFCMKVRKKLYLIDFQPPFGVMSMNVLECFLVLIFLSSGIFWLWQMIRW